MRLSALDHLASPKPSNGGGAIDAHRLTASSSDAPNARDEIAPRIDWTVADALDSADMARLVNGDDPALADLMRRHQGWLRKRLSKMLGNHADASDALQETFLRVYQHCRSFRPDARFHPWLCTIAFNTARNRLRWRRRQPACIPLPDDNAAEDDARAVELVDPGLPPPESLEQAEWLSVLEAAVDSLPPQLRAALEPYAFEDRAQADIAAELGCTVKAVELRVYHARQWLFQYLEHCAKKREGFRMPHRREWKVPVASTSADAPRRPAG